MNSAPSDFGVVSSSVQKKEGGGGGEEEDMSQFSLGNKWLHARDRSHPGRDLAWNQQFAPSAQKLVLFRLKIRVNLAWMAGWQRCLNSCLDDFCVSSAEHRLPRVRANQPRDRRACEQNS